MAKNPKGVHEYGRSGTLHPSSEYEKPVLLPPLDSTDPCLHAWTDARFATDIMMEHALFFVLLMPPETAAAERAVAQQFRSKFNELLKRIDGYGVPTTDSLPKFCKTVVDSIAPFIRYKKEMKEAQEDGALRSLVWPLFFKHTIDEAERWTARLTQLAGGDASFSRQEALTFWAGIVEEHGQFEAHLLDPQEDALIAAAEKNSSDFKAIRMLCQGSSSCPAVPANGSTDPILTAAQNVLTFETAAARGIDAATIKSIIDPRLADHLRRETLKFCDEIQRAV